MDTNETPLEDQRQQALKHYEEASNAIMHWSSFVRDAILAYDPKQNSHKHGISGKQLTFCQCEVPTGRTVTADFENQICDSCGRLVARASGALDKTVSDGFYCDECGMSYYNCLCNHIDEDDDH